MDNPVIIGGCELWLGDCSEILHNIKPADLLLTDPPYGIGEANGKNKSRGLLAVSKDYGIDTWDNAPPSFELLNLAINKCTKSIIFGGNYFGLPASSCWLVWDKDNGETDFADCELAWTNLDCAVRRMRFRWQGMLQENMGEKEVRVHPTQKPVPVMRWAMSHAKNAEVVLDPFMGSGTTGVACVEMGRRFVGIEREEKYFNAAIKRISMAVENKKQELFSVEEFL